MANPMKDIDRRAASIAVLNVLLVLLLIGIVIKVATVVNINIDDTNGTRLLRLSFFTSIFAALVFLCVIVSLSYIGISDHRRGFPISKLFASIMAQMEFLFAFFCFTTLTAIDYLSHNLTPKWDFLRQPEVRIVNVALYMGIVGSFSWFHWSVLTVHGWSKLKIAALYLGICAVVALIMLVAIILGGGA